MSLYHDVFRFTRIFVKEMLTAHTILKQHKFLVKVLSTILAYLIISLLLITFLISLIKNYLIRLFLWSRYNKKYEVVVNSDSYFEYTKNRITVVYIIEHSGSIQELQTIIKESTNRLLQSHYKFSSTIHNIFGVYYYLKNNVCLNDIFSIENVDVSTKDRLKDYLENHCFYDWDDQSLWKVVMFKSSITWNKMNDSKTYYPVLLRCSHCLGDGISLSMFLQKYFLNDVKSEYLKKVLEKSKCRNDFDNNNIGSGMVLVDPKLNYSEIDLTGCSRKLAVFVEEEPKYLYLIKYICKQLNCSFTDVITFCSMKSITDYLQSEGVKTENFIVFSTGRHDDDIELILEENILTNRIILDAYNLPLNAEILKYQNILSKFKKVLPILKNGRNFATRQITLLLSTFLSFLHPKLLMKLVQFNSIGTTLGITNIPVADCTSQIGPNIVNDVFVFANNCDDTKFYLAMVTYANRLETTLTTKKDLKISREELQEILDNTFLNINRLYEEMKLNEVK